MVDQVQSLRRQVNVRNLAHSSVFAIEKLPKFSLLFEDVVGYFEQGLGVIGTKGHVNCIEAEVLDGDFLMLVELQSV